MIIGLDFETTGLDVDRLSLLEIAIVLYTDELEEIDTYTAVIFADDLVLTSCDDIARQLHEASGLWDEIPEGKSLSQVREEVVEKFAKWSRYCDLKRTPLLGNSVHFDRALLRRFFRDQHDMLSHRNIDVSSLTELAKRWERDAIPRAFMSHRALDDVRESTRILEEYRKKWLRLAPHARLQAWVSRIRRFWRKN